MYVKQNTCINIKLNCPKICPFGITPVKKKVHKARAGWYHGPFCRSISDFLLKYSKKQNKIKNQGTGRSNEKLYKCITANTGATWQHAAHATDQLTSPSC